MTVVLSIASSDMIIMAADSAVVLDFGNAREYELGRKAYMYPGVGCVTTWGSRVGNQIGPFLDEALETYESPDVTDLAEITYEFLTKEYRPDELDLDDVGYHISGFDKERMARLFHVFWGHDRPRPHWQVDRKYACYDHSPPERGSYFLYNGRNDLAYAVINTFLSEVSSGGDTKLDLVNQRDRVLLVDLTLRFSSEITPQVGPPFIMYLINVHNQAIRIRNDNLVPIDREYVSDSIEEL
jgi:hypothetical protein